MSPLNSMPGTIRDLKTFQDADGALQAVTAMYEASRQAIRARFERFIAGERTGAPVDACYPYLGITVGLENIVIEERPAFGSLAYSGTYGTTLTRPDLFADYYREQIDLLLRYHKVPVEVGVSRRRIPLPFIIEQATAALTQRDLLAMEGVFTLPDLATTDDSIANGTYQARAGEPLPLALFTAERVDFALQRIHHYTGTDPEHFQRFMLFTNYQRYVEEFVSLGRQQARAGGEYVAFVEPGNVTWPNPQTGAEVSGEPPRYLPQMPAYHLVRPDKLGITLVNIGVGPSNAKTITDHLAVLRPHCWLMIGHCGGLRHTQRIGDYVLAHAYLRRDKVLDDRVPLEVPIPAIAEVQVALQQAAATVVGDDRAELRRRMRTGTVVSYADRNRERQLLSQSRAIAVDMESACIATQGFRMRVPYGVLLCISDKPAHGEIKLPGVADRFYDSAVGAHLRIGLEAIAG